MEQEQKIAIFQWQSIRKIIFNEELWFSVEDIIYILTDSEDPKQYMKKLRKRDEELWSNWGTICTLLEMPGKDWKKRNITASNTKWILRIIQSIHSPKVEPLKMRLAKVWYERIQEIWDPELSVQRAIATYEKKWYPKERIDIRARWIPVRKNLTKERDERWGNDSYSILTNEIYKAYSWMTNQEWLDFKWIKQWNLRDAMTPTELILTMLAEQSTTDITKARNAKWKEELWKASKDGGWVAYKARKELEQQTWIDPISDKNYLKEIKNKVDPNILC